MALFSRSQYLRQLERAGRQGILLEEFSTNPQDGGWVIKTSQDVEPILDQNKERANFHDGYSPSRELRQVASIPNIIVHKWLREGVNVYDENDWPEVKRRLNSSEYLSLRTSHGTI